MIDPILPRYGPGVAAEPDDRPYADVWRFAVAVYAQPGVEAACLRLQDGPGLDVPMLLFCLWSGFAGPGALVQIDIDAALDVARVWGKGVVAPLRATRRALKDETLGANAARIALRGTVAMAERDAERILLELLEARCSALAPTERGAEAARANLGRYCDVAGCVATSDIEADFALLVARAFSPAK